MHVLGSGTASDPLIVRALTFDKGYHSTSGGGFFVDNVATVDLELCIFSHCATGPSPFGGGALVAQSGGISNVYGTRFIGNSADKNSADDGGGDGQDMYIAGGTIIIHNTCPSPYSSKTPIQVGKTRMRIV